jgi:hypothetical protein
VTDVKEQVGPLETLTVKGVRWGKLCFVVAVEGEGGVRIDESEHQAWRWSDKDQIEQVAVMTEGQREVMRLGFLGWEQSTREGVVMQAIRLEKEVEVS